MPNEILQHDDDANELARVEPAVPVSATGSTAQTANGLSQPTPGPWTHHRGGSVRVCDGRHQSVEGCRSLAEAEIIGVPRPEAVANARLIAAAPDLLAALKHIAHNRDIAERGESVMLGEPCRRCGEPFGVVPGTQPDLCEDCFIAAAIEKAEGRS